MKLIRAYEQTVLRLYYDLGLALASAVTFSGVLALFPFLIFVTALASFFGGADAADRAVAQLFEIMPPQVAEAFAPAVRQVLGQARGDFLTVGFLLALVISASGVESLRTALNRAYGVKDRRSLWHCWLQSFGFVVGGAVAMLVVGFSIVLAPAIQAFAGDHFERLGAFVSVFDQFRVLIGTLVLFALLFAVHFWLPAGHRRLVDIWPGVVHTVVLWLFAGTAYSTYLAYYNYYTSMYAGLANIMISLFFFYISAVIFIFGAELNRTFLEEKSDGESAKP